MKIVSLLPSATEIVYALGLGDELIGVTEECDFPAEAVTKPVVSRSSLPRRPLSSREIDDAVRASMAEQQPLYVLDRELIRREQPDVILTQDLCRVCAVPSGQVQAALDDIGASDAKVLSLDPHSLDDVLDQIEIVGKLLGRADEATNIADLLRARVARIREIGERVPTVRVFALEWSDPPFVGGHWIPEMVEIAGAVNLLNERGGRSREVSWHDIADAAPEVIVFMPCGFYLEEAEQETAKLWDLPPFAETPAARNGNVFAVDATSYFSRPGPSVVDGLEIMAWAIHPESFPEPPAGTIAKLKRP